MRPTNSPIRDSQPPSLGFAAAGLGSGSDLTTAPPLAGEVVMPPVVAEVPELDPPPPHAVSASPRISANSGAVRYNPRRCRIAGESPRR